MSCLPCLHRGFVCEEEEEVEDTMEFFVVGGDPPTAEGDEKERESLWCHRSSLSDTCSSLYVLPCFCACQKGEEGELIWLLLVVMVVRRRRREAIVAARRERQSNNNTFCLHM